MRYGINIIGEGTCIFEHGMLVFPLRRRPVQAEFTGTSPGTRMNFWFGVDPH